jgi:starvation-inducible DNA-binding protein
MAKQMVNERTKTLSTLLPMRNGMSAANRKGVVDLLNLQVADHYIILTKTRFYHWNVEGPEFHDIHELLDEHYEILAAMVDELAEQCLKLGGQAAGTLEFFKKNTRLSEDPNETIPDTRSMLQNLLDDHESIMEHLYKDIKTTDEKYEDAVTSNLLQDFSAKHHKMAWMLRMMVQKSTIDAYDASSTTASSDGSTTGKTSNGSKTSRAKSGNGKR